jgi:hypothetical protein
MFILYREVHIQAATVHRLAPENKKLGTDCLLFSFCYIQHKEKNVEHFGIEP